METPRAFRTQPVGKDFRSADRAALSLVLSGAVVIGATGTKMLGWDPKELLGKPQHEHWSVDIEGPHWKIDHLQESTAFGTSSEPEESMARFTFIPIVPTDKTIRATRTQLNQPGRFRPATST